ncbi:MAG TPA: hypothetical protein DD727_08570 [Clostridiales bacterium]|nr:hypothetical protein [Clostridiales bacterium]
MVKKLKSFIYRYENSKSYPEYPIINSIGWEKRVYDPDDLYDYNCRKKNLNYCVFQYTISGEGMLDVNGEVHKIKPGDAFLVEAPGPCRYWLPPSSPCWEFMYISLSMASLHYWNRIVDAFGRVISLPQESPVIKYLNKLYSKALAKYQPDIFMNSLHAFSFLMHLQNYLEERSLKSKKIDVLQHCIDIFQARYQESLDLTLLSEYAGVSANYIIKLFKRDIGTTPIQYLNTYRLKVAESLLLETNSPVAFICRKCGFKNANYFIRLFKRKFRTTPSQYRIQHRAGNQHAAATAQLFEYDVHRRQNRRLK